MNKNLCAAAIPQKNGKSGDRQTLLQKAKKIATVNRKLISNEHVELALAWAKDEISYSQVQEVITGKRGGMTAYVTLARALREHIRNTL